MRMMHQVLPPGVQQGEKPDACPQVTWIPGDRLQCFGDGLKQDCIDRSLILKCNGAELSRQREDDVKVRDRQQFISQRNRWPPRRAVEQAAMSRIAFRCSDESV